VGVKTEGVNMEAAHDMETKHMPAIGAGGASMKHFNALKAKYRQLAEVLKATTMTHFDRDQHWTELLAVKRATDAMDQAMVTELAALKRREERLERREAELRSILNDEERSLADERRRLEAGKRRLHEAKQRGEDMWEEGQGRREER